MLWEFANRTRSSKISEPVRKVLRPNTLKGSLTLAAATWDWMAVVSETAPPSKKRVKESDGTPPLT